MAVKLPADAGDRIFERDMTPEERAVMQKLRDLAKRVADDACVAINNGVDGIPDKPMPYKAQYVLAKAVDILRGRI